MWIPRTAVEQLGDRVRQLNAMAFRLGRKLGETVYPLVLTDRSELRIPFVSLGHKGSIERSLKNVPEVIGVKGSVKRGFRMGNIPIVLEYEYD